MFKRILVPIDGSAHSTKAAEMAMELAFTYKAELTLLHVARKFELPDQLKDYIKAEQLTAHDMLAIDEATKRVIADIKISAEGRGIKKIKTVFREGKPARSVTIAEDEASRLRQLQLLTAKPVMYVCNVDEESAATGNAHSARVMEHAKKDGAAALVVSAKIEAEIAQLKTAAEKNEFLAALGLAEPGLNRIVRAGHELLGLITYLTTGPTESRAWTLPKNTRAQEAAGKIHSDMERGFIAAETASFDEFVRLGGEQAVRNAGRMRQEGRDYIMQDGDVVLFRFNV